MTVAQHVRAVRSPEGRIPVNDVAAERSLLSAILDDEARAHSTAYDRVADIVRSEHMFDPRHQVMLEAVEAMATEGTVATWSAVTFWLRDREMLERAGGEAYVRQVSLADSTAFHLEHDAARIRDLWRQRKMGEEGHRLVAESYDRRPDVQSWLSDKASTLESIASPPGQKHMVQIGQSISSVFTAMEAAAARGERITGLTTGFRELDGITGGSHKKELTIVGGRPGMGKTAFGMQLAVNAACAEQEEGAPMNGIAFFSVEMPHEQLVLRTICTQAKVNLEKVRQGMVQAADWQLLAAAGGWLGALPIWIDDDSALTPQSLRAKCRRLIAREEKRGIARVAAVVVDYLQRMKSGLPPDHRKSRNEEVALIARSLKELGKELDVPVIAMAQVGRDVDKQKDKRPSLADLRESGDIENEADTVIFIHRPEYYSKESCPEEERGMAELIVAKQRNGGTRTAKTRFRKEIALFEDDR